jgi:hypothetical protein
MPWWERADDLLLLSGARLPTARMVILPAAATPLNRCRAARARPRFVQTVFLERAARLAPLRVRTDYVGHDDHATLRCPRVKVLRQSRGCIALIAVIRDVPQRRKRSPARFGGSSHKPIRAESPGRPDEDVGYQTHSREACGAREGQAGVAQRIAVVLLEEEFGGERGSVVVGDCLIVREAAIGP